MDFSNFDLLKVDSNTQIKPFNCDDEDLNSFLLEKSIGYSNELLATTFVIEDTNETIAYFSIFNDSVKVHDIEFASKSAAKRFLSNLVSHPKRHLKYFPALKIGRLAVTNSQKTGGIGKSIIYFIIDKALQQNEICACKLITVDAYDKSLGFYEKMGFTYFSDLDKGKDTRQMYIDLTPLMDI